MASGPGKVDGLGLLGAVGKLALEVRELHGHPRHCRSYNRNLCLFLMFIFSFLMRFKSFASGSKVKTSFLEPAPLWMCTSIQTDYHRSRLQASLVFRQASCRVINP